MLRRGSEVSPEPIKRVISSCSIDDDQERVARQWAETFLRNLYDPATDMPKFMWACIVKGNLKVRTFPAKDDAPWTDPSDQLTAIDYLSHGSRIVLDYQGLTDTKKRDKLLKLFPTAKESPLVSNRSATHAVTRENGRVKESKDFMLGVKGQLRKLEQLQPLYPHLLNEVCDFGINIAMGGDINGFN